MDNYTPDPFNTAQNQTDSSTDSANTYANNAYNNTQTYNQTQATNVNSSYSDYTDMYSQPANNTNTYANSGAYNNGTYNQGYNNAGYNAGYNNGTYNQGYNNGTYNNTGYSQNYNTTYNNGTYNQGYVNNTPYTNYNAYQPVAGNFPSYGTYLTLSILSFIFTSWICGLISIIQITKGNTAYKNGDAFTYQKCVKNSKTALIVGLVIGILNIILQVSLFMLGS